MKIVAFMQNQWLKNAGQHQRTMDHYQKTDLEMFWKWRQRSIPFALFRGCKTGRILKLAFGDLCESIIWEEASTRIGSKPADAFPADIVHMRAVLAHYNPDLLITFGKIATDGIEQLDLVDGIFIRVIKTCHPCARGHTGSTIVDVATEVRRLLSVKEQMEVKAKSKRKAAASLSWGSYGQPA